MNPEKKAYLKLHLAVLLYGFTAILGDLISLSAINLVWWRVFIASISLLFFVDFGRQLRQISKKYILRYLSIGFIVGLHWLTFFGAIKLSNASVCLVCMATASFFTAFLEPIVLRQAFKWYEILLGAMVIPGMVLVVNNLHMDMMWGVGVGLLSSFLAALFATLNKKWINGASPYSITFLELGGAWLLVSGMLPFYLFANSETAFFPNNTDWIYLLILALGCTTFAYMLGLTALKHLSAFAANLTINLEPVYGIILAWLLLNEHKEMNMGFYIGCSMILLAVFSYPIFKRPLRNKDIKKG